MTAHTVPRLFITTDAIGGVWSYSIALARRLAEFGWQSTLAILGPAPDDTQSALVREIQGCELTLTGLPLEWRLASKQGLQSVTKQLVIAACEAGATSVHVHAPSLAASPWPLPIVAVAHSCVATWFSAVHGTQPSASLAWHAEATAEGLRNCDVAVAPTQAFADALRRAYGTKREIKVIRNGLPPPALSSTPREDFVLAAGRLWDHAKNIKLLDEAARSLDFPIEAVGSLSSPEPSDLRFHFIRTHGQLPASALHSLMARAGAFASPALYEPFGLSVLEAAQLGTPLVLSDIPSFRELWSDAAIFLPTDDPSAWAQELNALMNDPPKRMRLGEAAKQRASVYTDHAMAWATVRLHEKIGRHAYSAA